jgi:hypothetical protein
MPDKNFCDVTGRAGERPKGEISSQLQLVIVNIKAYTNTTASL